MEYHAAGSPAVSLRQDESDRQSGCVRARDGLALFLDARCVAAGRYPSGDGRDRPATETEAIIAREGRRKRSLEGETPQRLIAAARKAFARYGYDRTTNEDIADEARTTTGAIYHYFSSKADLFAATTRQVEQVLLAGLRSSVHGASTTTEKLHNLLDAAVGLGEQGEDLARFVAIAPVELERREEFRELHQSLFGEVVAFFAEIVREGKARGEVAEDVDVQAAADMLLAALFGIALQAGLYAHQISLRRVVDAFQRLIEGRLFTPAARADEGAPRSRALRGLRR